MLKMNSIVVSTVTAIVLLSGCGSDSGSGGSGDSGLDLGTNGYHYTVEFTQSMGSMSVVDKAAADGKLEAVKTSYGVDFRAKEDMTVVDAKEVIKGKYTFSDGEKVEGSVSYDYKNGTEHIDMTGSVHGHIVCDNYYESPLPIYETALSDFEFPDMNENTMTDSTCPDWVRDENIDPVEMEAIDDWTITDSDDTVSHAYEYIKVSSGSDDSTASGSGSSSVDLSAYDGVVLLHNLNSSVKDAVLNAYDSYSNMTSKEISGDVTCPSLGFSTIISESTSSPKQTVYQKGSKVCSDVDYSDMSGASGSVNIAVYYNY